VLEGELDPAKKEEFLQWRGVFSCHGLLMGDPLIHFLYALCAMFTP